MLEKDASGFGLGVVQMQDNRPMAFYSKLFGPRAQQKSIYEKKLMEICMAVQKWHFYLLGRQFVVRTDQQSLSYITQQREIRAYYEKLISKLLGFSFKI